MPRLIDTAQRRREYADAVFRVIAQEGLQAVSVRSVATNAGVSVGALRHLFPSQSALLAFAMQESAERLADGIRAQSGAEPRARALEQIAHLLPTTKERERFVRVWLSFAVASLTDADLAPVRRQWFAQGRAFCRLLLETLQEAGVVRDDLDLDLQATTLHMLIDGATLHDATDGGGDGLQVIGAYLRSLAPDDPVGPHP